MKKFNLLALGKLVAAFLLSVLATNLVLADEVSVRFTFWDSPSEPVQLALREGSKFRPLSIFRRKLSKPIAVERSDENVVFVYRKNGDSYEPYFMVPVAPEVKNTALILVPVKPKKQTDSEIMRQNSSPFDIFIIDYDKVHFGEVYFYNHTKQDLTLVRHADNSNIVIKQGNAQALPRADENLEVFSIGENNENGELKLFDRFALQFDGEGRGFVVAVDSREENARTPIEIVSLVDKQK